MGKPSKEKLEYERALNELFGTRIKWSRLAKHELEELVDKLTGQDRCQLCEKLDCVTERYPILEVAVRTVGKVGKEGPIIKALKSLLLPTEEAEEE